RTASGAVRRASSRPVSGTTSRTTPGAPLSATSESSAVNAAPSFASLNAAPGCQVPTDQSRVPPAVVTSHLPLGLNDTLQYSPTDKSQTHCPVRASQIFAPGASRTL